VEAPQPSAVSLTLKEFSSGGPGFRASVASRGGLDARLFWVCGLRSGMSMVSEEKIFRQAIEPNREKSDTTTSAIS
jgi:hypothetical protein